MAYSNITMPLNVPLALMYLAETVSMRSNYSYNYDQALAVTDLASYNSMVWTDNEPKPSFSAVQAASGPACTYYGCKPSIEQDVSHIKDYLLTGLPSDISGVMALPSRVSGLETAVDSLNSWRGSKATKINPISTTPTDNSIAILGIQVPTASSFTALLNFAVAIRNQNNSILTMLTAREIMA